MFRSLLGDYKKMTFKVRWGECGDYDNIEESFESEGMARNYYDKIIKENKDIWIELIKVLRSRSCS